MTFDDYQKKALATLLPSANNIPYIALGLTSEAGEVAGKIKKWIRDSGEDISKLDKVAIADELGDTLWYLALMAQKLDIKLETIAQGNADKLSSRLERGKLTGSGDSR
ncbi:MAG: nucleoside triphosphate pyrophosphohydrolase family protein [bacterium]|nr:nucleoside triphosphate pyrophosphohydrolase family protein [bacterium]